MKKTFKNEKGFSSVEAILIIIVIALIGVVGYMIYKNHHKNPPAVAVTKTVTTPAKPSTTVNPYAGWKTFTLTVEKLSFMYPTDWTVSNTAPTATQDDTILTSSDGSTLEIVDGISNGGDPRQLDSGSPVPINYISQSDDLVFGWARMANPNGPSGYSSIQVQSAVLLTNPSNQYSMPSDVNAVGPNDTTGAINAKNISITYLSKSPLTPAQMQTSPSFIDAKLIIKSMHY